MYVQSGDCTSRELSYLCRPVGLAKPAVDKTQGPLWSLVQGMQAPGDATGKFGQGGGGP